MRGIGPVTGELVAVLSKVNFLAVSATLATSIRNAFPVLNCPVVVKGTDSEVPAHKVVVVSELVDTVGTRTVIVAVVLGSPTPHPLLTLTI